MSEPAPKIPTVRTGSVPVRTTAAAPASRVFVERTSRRDIFIGTAIGAVLLALVAWGIVVVSKMPGRPSTNQLTGVIVAKHDAGMKEREITFGKKGLKALETDSGYSFDVRTEPDGRVYEVPVPKVQFGMYEVGAKYSFIRPPSEQH